MRSMKALVKSRPEPGLRLEAVPVPEVRDFQEAFELMRSGNAGKIIPDLEKI